MAQLTKPRKNLSR